MTLSAISKGNVPPPLPRLGFRERHSKFLRILHSDIEVINRSSSISDPAMKFSGRTVCLSDMQKVFDAMNEENLITNDPKEDSDRLAILQDMQKSVLDAILISDFFRWKCNYSWCSFAYDIRIAIATFQSKSIVPIQQEDFCDY